jgi:heterodisulfide reductase subunit B
MKYAYFPGCSLEAGAREYDVSCRAVLRELGSEVEEIPDWNCCGTLPAEAVSYLKGLSLSARNLAIAESMGHDTVVAPCSACYLSLAKVNVHRERDAKVRAQLDEVLGAAGLTYKGTLKVRHMLDVFANDFDLEKVRARVKRPLKGLRVVPYYGCQTVRPHLTYDGPDLPVTMDRMLEALGAEVVPYNYKVRCCGGTMLFTARASGQALVAELFRGVEDADCFATVCPLCQGNLDANQSEASAILGREIRMPVLYLSQLMGLAFDLPADEILLKKNIVSPDAVLKKLS